jgi:hypothetical protein
MGWHRAREILHTFISAYGESKPNALRLVYAAHPVADSKSKACA